ATAGRAGSGAPRPRCGDPQALGQSLPRPTGPHADEAPQAPAEGPDGLDRAPARSRHPRLAALHHSPRAISDTPVANSSTPIARITASREMRRKYLEASQTPASPAGIVAAAVIHTPSCVARPVMTNATRRRPRLNTVVS